jgi:hypothetical protein
MSDETLPRDASASVKEYPYRVMRHKSEIAQLSLSDLFIRKIGDNSRTISCREGGGLSIGNRILATFKCGCDEYFGASIAYGTMSSCGCSDQNLPVQPE